MHSPRDIIDYNNLVITEITREINKSINNNETFVLEEKFLIINDILDKYLSKKPKKYQKDKVKKEILQQVD